MQFRATRLDAWLHEDEGDVDEELRNKIAEALRINGADARSDDEESDEGLMDDDQMMAIDEQLAQIFKARLGDKTKSHYFPKTCQNNH